MGEDSGLKELFPGEEKSALEVISEGDSFFVGGIVFSNKGAWAAGTKSFSFRDANLAFLLLSAALAMILLVTVSVLSINYILFKEDKSSLLKRMNSLLTRILIQSSGQIASMDWF